jgi:quercetin dioxygenase-like cupin family protein
MKPRVHHRIHQGSAAEETWFQEGCWIQEWSNHPDDPDCSIARARVPAGARTRWHRLHGTNERYVVLQGHGRVDVCLEGQFDPDLEPTIERTEIGPGDVVIIPAGAGQRVQAHDEELVFLAVCTPRFDPARYEDIDPDR